MRNVNYLIIQNIVNTRNKQETKLRSGWKNWIYYSLIISFCLFFFFFLYLENHHVTSRGFRCWSFFSGDKRNLRHVFRRVSKDRDFFRRVARDYREYYGPRVNSIPYTLPNLLSRPFKLDASWAVACKKREKKRRVQETRDELKLWRDHAEKFEIKILACEIKI